MINIDTLIKVSRKRGYKYTWPDQVLRMKKRLDNVKLGFPGINNNHISLVEYKKIKIDDLYIYDLYIETGDGDEAPLLLQNISNNKSIIEGIGCGADSIRDPDRIKFRWKDKIETPNIPENFLVWRVDARPNLTGGSAYYYFFKSYRDNRL